MTRPTSLRALLALDEPEFVERAHEVLLGHPPTAGARAHHLARLAQYGVSRFDILDALCLLPESRGAGCIPGLAWALFWVRARRWPGVGRLVSLILSLSSLPGWRGDLEREGWRLRRVLARQQAAEEADRQELRHHLSALVEQVEGLRQDLTASVREVAGVGGRVDGLDQRVAVWEGREGAATAVREHLTSSLQDVANRLADLGGRVEAVKAEVAHHGRVIGLMEIHQGGEAARQEERWGPVLADVQAGITDLEHRLVTVAGAVDDLSTSVPPLITAAAVTTGGIEEARVRLEGIERRLGDCALRGDLEQKAAADAMLLTWRRLDRLADHLEQRIVALEAGTTTGPDGATPVADGVAVINHLVGEWYHDQGLPVTLDGAAAVAIVRARAQAQAQAYQRFEDRHRGSEGEIRARLHGYRSRLAALASDHRRSYPVIDLGCGRGEWLTLLAEEGIEGLGVDNNPVAVARCRQRGLRVSQADLFPFLADLAPASVALVSAFHVVEHLPRHLLQPLVEEIRRVLVPGGLVLLETPNSHNLEVAGHALWIDPTHVAPVPAPLLEFLFADAGFRAIESWVAPRPAPAIADPAVAGIIDAWFHVGPDLCFCATRGGE